MHAHRWRVVEICVFNLCPLYAKDVDHLHNLVLVALGPPYAYGKRESGEWVCVSDSFRKRQKMDTQSLILRHIVSKHFTIRAYVRVWTVSGDVPSDVMHATA
jgi:hypothetical protein